MSRKSVDEVIMPINNTKLLPFGTGTQLLRLDIPLTNEFLIVLTELCKIKEWDLKRYVTKALYDAVELDLACPTEIGLDVCKSLKMIIHPEGGT
jgi:hypothetical protein